MQNLIISHLHSRDGDSESSLGQLSERSLVGQPVSFYNISFLIVLYPVVLESNGFIQSLPNYHIPYSWYFMSLSGRMSPY